MEEKLTYKDGRVYKGLEYYNNLSGQQQLIEMMKCRKSLLYWFETYAYAPVTGGAIHMGTSEQWKSTAKFRILVQLFDQRDTVQLLSSRQIGKTTIALMYALYCMIFFPGIKAMFLTLNSELAKDAVVRMKGIMEMLPRWMQVKNSSDAAKTTFIDLINGSTFKTSFISGAVDPDKAGRGMSYPILICDEFAFCNHADIVYSAMQPALSTARIYAKKNGYPTCIIMVSTPNGAGNNTFYRILQNSVKIEDIYDFENNCMYKDYQKEFQKEESNGYISVTIHWSETQRDEEWYKQQCKDLNFNKRRINQELDLVFLGSSSSIFSDDIIQQLTIKKSIHNIKLSAGHFFKIFGEIDPNDMYLMGCDSSASTGANSDFSAISLIHAETGQEVGVWKGKFSVVKKLSNLLKEVIHGLNKLYGLDSDNLRVIIERNSFGKGVVEELVYHDVSIDGFDYEPYVWQDQYKDGEHVYGFWTGNTGKLGAGRRDQMFSELMNHVNDYPKLIHSSELINDLRELVQLPSGRIEAGKGAHDDVVMAYNFCLYVRKQMIKSGEISVNGEAAPFALSSDRMKDFIDVSLSSGNSGNFAYISNYEDNQNKTKSYKSIEDNFDIENYIIVT